MREPAPREEGQGTARDVGRGGLSTSLIEDVAAIAPLRSRWDALAVRVGTPFGAPAWAEAWWRHLAPRGAALATVAVCDGDELIGLAPFFASRRFGVTEFRLLSGGLASRLGVLAGPGREREVATAMTRMLGDLAQRPNILRWEAVDASSPWPGWLSADWEGERGHRIHEVSRRSAPVVKLDQASYEEWLGGKSRNFRSQMRRRRRAIEEKGASIRCADRASLERDLEGFFGLHAARWEGRGGSAAISPGTTAMLKEVGEALIESARFRLWMIDGPDGTPVSAQLFVEAGGVIAYWNGGFDERWGEYSPGVLAILAAIEDAFERKDRLLDLGGGEAGYKERLADEDRPIAWITSYLPGWRYPLARLRRMPGETARRASHTLRARFGADRLNRVRGILKR